MVDALKPRRSYAKSGSFSSSIVRAGMYRDTTLTGATRAKALVRVREEAEEVRAARSAVRHAARLEQERRAFDLALKKKLRRLDRRRRRREMRSRDRAACAIQHAWLRYAEWKDQMLEELFHESAVAVQCLVRGHFGRREAGMRLFHHHSRCALAVQRVLRGRNGRRLATIRRRDFATLHFQRLWRGRSGRRLAHAIRTQRAARHIQRAGRGMLAKITACALRISRAEAAERSSMAFEDEYSAAVERAAKAVRPAWNPSVVVDAEVPLPRYTLQPTLRETSTKCPRPAARPVAPPSDSPPCPALETVSTECFCQNRAQIDPSASSVASSEYSRNEAPAGGLGRGGLSMREIVKLQQRRHRREKRLAEERAAEAEVIERQRIENVRRLENNRLSVLRAKIKEREGREAAAAKVAARRAQAAAEAAEAERLNLERGKKAAAEIERKRRAAARQQRKLRALHERQQQLALEQEAKDAAVRSKAAFDERERARLEQVRRAAAERKVRDAEEARRAEEIRAATEEHERIQRAAAEAKAQRDREAMRARNERKRRKQHAKEAREQRRRDAEYEARSEERKAKADELRSRIRRQLLASEHNSCFGEVASGRVGAKSTRRQHKHLSDVRESSHSIEEVSEGKIKMTSSSALKQLLERAKESLQLPDIGNLPSAEPTRSRVIQSSSASALLSPRQNSIVVTEGIAAKPNRRRRERPVSSPLRRRPPSVPLRPKAAASSVAKAAKDRRPVKRMKKGKKKRMARETGPSPELLSRALDWASAIPENFEEEASRQCGRSALAVLGCDGATESAWKAEVGALNFATDQSVKDANAMADSLERDYAARVIQLAWLERCDAREAKMQSDDQIVVASQPFSLITGRKKQHQGTRKPNESTHGKENIGSIQLIQG